jgi:hypothetical protein
VTTPPETPVDFAHTAYAEQARIVKAAALEGVLRAEGIPADAVLSLPPAARRRIERAAGIRRSSEDTWAKAVWLMEQEDADRHLFRR